MDSCKIAVMGTNPRIYINKNLLNEDWALKIHGQTLDRLAERGGLAPIEIFANVARLLFKDFKLIDPHNALKVAQQLAIKSNESPAEQHYD